MNSNCMLPDYVPVATGICTPDDSPDFPPECSVEVAMANQGFCPFPGEIPRSPQCSANYAYNSDDGFCHYSPPLP